MYQCDLLYAMPKLSGVAIELNYAYTPIFNGILGDTCYFKCRGKSAPGRDAPTPVDSTI